MGLILSAQADNRSAKGPDFQSGKRRFSAFASSLIMLWVCGITSVQAQGAPAAPVVTGAPDVLVLVYQRPGLGDQVDVTYARKVPHDQVRQDIAALTQETGWVIGPNAVKDEDAPVQSKVGPMTSIAFTAPNVVRDDLHTLPVETFVRAFRHYKRLNLVFIVDSGFTFQGPRQYADNYIQSTLDQHGAAYTYQIAILNPDFDRLSLTAPHTGTPSGGRHTSPWLILLGILGGSALVGAVVFLVTKRLTPSQTETKTKTHDDSEESRETVIKR